MTLVRTHTVAEVADAFRCNEKTIRDWIRRAGIHPLRIGDRANAPYRLSDADVDRLRDAMTPTRPQAVRRRRRT